jgi:hypothetical protein
MTAQCQDGPASSHEYCVYSSSNSSRSKDIGPRDCDHVLVPQSLLVMNEALTCDVADFSLQGSKIFPHTGCLEDNI